MKEPITISLIAPVYRVEKFIGRFAESVFGQSYPHIQLIVVNDETDDSSMEILKSLIQTEDARLKDKVILVDQPHAGLPAARKTGLEYATGDYVWHVDSDDWLETDAAQKIAECASRTDADVIYFDFWREYGGKTELAVERDYDSSGRQEYQRRMFNHEAYGCVWNKCVKRSMYVDNIIHFPDYSHAEDTFLMSQLIGYSRSIVHLKETLYHYRKDNPAALTRQGRKRRCSELIRNYLTLYELYQGMPDSPVDPTMDDVFYRAGRYSLMYGLGLFKDYPYLADRILEAGLKNKAYTSLPVQILLKIYARFYRR